MPKTENSLTESSSGRADASSSTHNYVRSFLLLFVLLAAIYLIVGHIGVFSNVLIVLLGFGGVVLVHEFGHFIVAKMSDIKVEAFSIFIPPTVVALQRTEEGLRIRILPKFFPKAKERDDDPDEGVLSFTVGRGGKAGETEYRIGLIPFGGFVKMLGQDDTAAAGKTDDPRSYANKPVSARMAVIAAGVTFNALSAVVAFMIVFLVGIKLPPPIVGAVVPDSPAERAGIKAGDEVIEVNGKRQRLDFSDILLAAALASRDEQVKLSVRRGERRLDFVIVPKEPDQGGAGIRMFGVLQPQTLVVGKVSDPNVLLEKTGLLPGDKIVAVNGEEVTSHWELTRMVAETVEPAVTFTAERTEKSGKTQRIQTRAKTRWRVGGWFEADSESKLYNVASMVPRLRIIDFNEPVPAIKGLMARLGIGRKVLDEDSRLMPGDIILATGGVEYPTYTELQEIAKQYEGEELPVTVLRSDANGADMVLTVNVKPRRPRGGSEPVIGITVELDVEHPVVAKTITDEDGPQALSIPRGAVIKAVNGTEVSSFFDVARQISANRGLPIRIEYGTETTTGEVVLGTQSTEGLINIKAALAKRVPFEDMKRLYKATGPIDAIVTGWRKTVMFMAQTYVTLRRVVGGLVSPRTVMGPVGILAASYTVVTKKPLIDYVYLLALISACIAVVNLLPLPPFDGGHVVLLLVERIKGSALSERTQSAIAYAGVVLVVALFLYLTFNDILNMFLR